MGFCPEEKRAFLQIGLQVDRVAVLIDGKLGKTYQRVLSEGPVFSKDGRRYGYISEAVQGPTMVIIDGVETSEYYTASHLVFSGDGEHFAYVASKGAAKFVVVDGKEASDRGASRYIDLLTMTHNGAAWAWAALLEDKKFAAFRGPAGTRVGDTYRQFKSMGFTADDRLWFVAVREDGKEVFFLEGKDADPVEKVLGVVPSADGRCLVAHLKSDEGEHVLEEGRILLRVGKEERGIRRIHFAPYSQTLVCVSGSGDTAKLWIESARGSQLEQVSVPPRSWDINAPFAFEANGTRLALGLASGKEYWWKVFKLGE
jgi:hypothetical protein